MSAYCTNDDVALEAKVTGGFDATTTPTADKVDDIIDEGDAEINGVVVSKYLLPISRPTNLLILKSISIALAVDRVRGILDANGGGQGYNKSESKLAAEAARKRLNMIQQDLLKLEGETLKTTADGVRSFAADNNLSATFQRDVDQW